MLKISNYLLGYNMAYQFPYDNRGDYPGKIIFRPFAPPVPNVNVPAITNLLADAIAEFAEGAEAAAFDGGGVDLSDRVVYGAEASQERRRYELGSKVVLYLPQAITFSDQAEYENANLGAVGGVAEGLLNRGASAGATLSAAVREGTSAFSDLITGNTGASSEAARLAVTRIAQNAPGPAGDVASSFLRVAINPNKRTLFRSVNIREFAFQFKMIANSAREAQEIENIIRVFRKELYPSVVEGAEVVGFNFPNLFDIQMKYNNQPVATKIKPSYLRNIQITYNPSSMGWHIDGKPSEVDMTLAFVEERTLNKSDILGGF
jgi:hypothetical protein